MLKKRIRLDLTYNGAAYSGWQAQAQGEVTIQQTVEAVIEKVTGQSSRITASGRTDTGVHALCQPCHVDIDTKLSDNELLKAFNSLLPSDISVLTLETVDNEWNARHSAKSKKYRYVILNRKFGDPFRVGRVWRIAQPLDIEAMRSGGERLLGQHDFSSFQSTGCAAKEPIRVILSLTIEQNVDEIVIEINGTGFLKHMVRNIVGTLVEVGRGKKEPAWVTDVINARNRKEAGQCAPACGLYLVSVSYSS